MIYLDMDGVLTDFHSSAFKLFGVNQPDNDGLVHEVLGISKSVFWKKIDQAGESWWTNMPAYPRAKEFVDELKRADEVVILTSPGPLPQAASGKTKWLQNFFGSNFKDYAICSRKELLASPGDILIDDLEKNIDKFTQKGGIGILHPQPWNRNHAKTNERIEYTLKTVSQVYPYYKSPEVADY